MQCLAVALTGLNPAVHPAVRRPWRERFALIRALRVHTQQDFKEIVQSAHAIKEAIRLHLAATFIADCATLDAMRHARHPTGQLCVPPMGMPAGSLAAAMHRMADAGAAMVGQARVGGRGHQAAPRERAALAQEGRVASGPAPEARARAAELLVVVVGRPLGPLVHDPAPGGPGGQRLALGLLPRHLHPLLAARQPPRPPRVAPRLGAVRRAAPPVGRAPHVHAPARRAVTEGRAPRLGQRGRVAPHRGAGVRALGLSDPPRTPHRGCRAPHRVAPCRTRRSTS